MKNNCRSALTYKMERVVSTFLASVVVLLGISSVSACVDRAKPALGMLGGWRQVDLIHADDVLLAKAAAYAEEAVVEMNKLSNEVTPYELATNPKTGEYRVVEVYTQVVEGVFSTHIHTHNNLNKSHIHTHMIHTLLTRRDPRY